MEGNAVPMSNYKVLIVDDELLVRENLRDFAWEKHGFELCGEARNGEEGCALIRERRPEIVITDIGMPVVDGLQLVERTKDAYPETSFILLTCHTEFDYARRALQLGAVDYLVKGVFRDEDLLLALEKAASLHLPRTAGKSAALPQQRYEIEAALKYMADHLHLPLTKGDVAEHVGLSANYFSALFKSKTGETFQDYLKSMRIERACKLLRTTNAKVYEIAEQVGIPNYRYFSEVFEKSTGSTPKQYRG